MKFILSFFIVCLLYAFSFIDERDSYIVTRVKQDYDKSFVTFKAELFSFVRLISASSSSSQIKTQHLKLRESYKSFEYLIAHFDNQAVKQHLNGAPLPVTQYDGKQVLVLEPVGLQVLDEVVFDEIIERERVQELVEALAMQIEEIHDFERNRYIDETHILMAMREQIIRIVSMGLTGYDTPGSLNALPEAKVSLTSMLNSFKYYSTLVTDENDILYKTILNHFSASIQYIAEAESFDSFDRTHFIREFMNPLSAQLLVFHVESDIPFIHEELALEKGYQYKSFHMFSQNAINPNAFSGYVPTIEDEAITRLGSFLFYDDMLSHDMSMSCATCHQPGKAFTDGLALSSSKHIQEAHSRNTPTLINSVYSQRFFYDLRAQKLNNQILEVFANPNEFHADFELIENRLLDSPGYIKLIRDAFPSNNKSVVPEIDRHTVVSALSAYVKTLRSFDSEFDRYMRFEKEAIDASVIHGFNLFMGKAACGTCHFAPAFSGLIPPGFDENETEVLGVPISRIDTLLDDDPGRYGNGWKHEAAEHFRHSFKTMSVRNISLTAPYMHNGIFETLDEVMDFYNHGGGLGMGIDVPYQTLAADSLHLSQLEVDQIVDFMESLTDADFDYIVPDTLPRFLDTDGNLNSERQSMYTKSYQN